MKSVDTEAKRVNFILLWHPLTTLDTSPPPQTPKKPLQPQVKLNIIKYMIILIKPHARLESNKNV